MSKKHSKLRHITLKIQDFLRLPFKISQSEQLDLLIKKYNLIRKEKNIEDIKFEYATRCKMLWIPYKRSTDPRHYVSQLAQLNNNYPLYLTRRWYTIMEMPLPLLSKYRKWWTTQHNIIPTLRQMFTKWDYRFDRSLSIIIRNYINSKKHSSILRYRIYWIINNLNQDEEDDPTQHGSHISWSKELYW